MEDSSSKQVKNNMRTILLCLLLLTPTSPLALASGNEEAGSNIVKVDTSTIDGIIAAYYAAVSGPAGGHDDYGTDELIHHPDAQIILSSRNQAGGTAARVMTLEELHGNRKPRTKDFYEWETDRKVQQYGNMAQVWSSYAMGPKPGEVTSTGVNSLTLLWDGQRWWIMNWMADYRE